MASEYSLLAVRKTRIEELVKKGRRRARLVKSALEQLDKFISATQLGVTIASLGLGWIGEPAVAKVIEPNLQFLPTQTALITSHTVAVVIAFFIITVLHIVLGELAPKTIALQKSEPIALLTITPLVLFAKMFSPLIWFLRGAGNLVVRVLGFKLTPKQAVHSEEEIKMILAQSALSGQIEQKEAEMVQSVFSFADTAVSQIMIPKKKIIALDSSLTLSDAMKKIEGSFHSRFPVYSTVSDTVLGFVHIKDIYRAILQGDQDKTIVKANIIRKIITVDEARPIDDILLTMREKQIHIAVVKNKNKTTVGLVSLEDILEKLVGEIKDEFEAKSDSS